MTKPKRARVLHQNQNAQPNPKTSSQNGPGKKHRKMSSYAKLSTKNNHNSNNSNLSGNKENNAPAKKNEKHQQKQHRRPIVPFRRKDRILLVGEGDFSFAHSLATHHRCRNLVATCYDSKETLYDKYPQAEKNIAEILASSQPKKQSDKEKADETEGPNTSSSSSPKVFFSVDAKKLGQKPGGGRDIRVGLPRKERKVPAWKKKDKDAGNMNQNKGGPWDMICFNFPHVGGLSTDVNRQVRANQELLVAFFKACVPLLAGRPEGVDEDEDEANEWGSDEDEPDESASEEENENEDIAKAKNERRTEPGQILVTLFEGEPYTLWNIRDLARHAGLRVVTSFNFPWASYCGYSHARTIGEIEGKDGGRGGWRGEDRDARMYVFELKTEDRPTTGKRKKRSAESEDSDSD
ncbi:hypothetical protein BDV18DRAFT_160869 [Aspergillus unguis]